MAALSNVRKVAILRIRQSPAYRPVSAVSSHSSAVRDTQVTPLLQIFPHDLIVVLRENPVSEANGGRLDVPISIISNRRNRTGVLERPYEK